MSIMGNASGLICVVLLASGVISSGTAATAQVSPTEVKDARAKANEQKYMPQLVSLQKSIGAIEFPFTFRLARYLDARPGQRAALDSNGLEFVVFQQRIVLKVSGFYRVAFNSMQVTQGGRATQTFKQAVLPILQLITEQMPQNYDYDAIGFEILYDARDSSGSYDYEGHEVLTTVISRDDAFSLVQASTDAERQEILERSDVFVNGKGLELALGPHDPADADVLHRPGPRPAVQSASFTTSRSLRTANSTAVVSDVTTPQRELIESLSADVDAMDLQRRLQAEVSAIRDGATRPAQQDAMPPSLEIHDGQRMLHYTMQNTLSFDTQRSSIYRRAAQSFDLFLAPGFKDIFYSVKEDAALDALHFSVLNRLGAEKSETIEFICPIDSMRSFVEDKMTTQDLINKSVVLVNGVRIGLELQLVE